jgi:hypothetical protein
MDAAAIIAVSAAVVALVQLAKWGFLKDSQGPLGVMVLSVVGVGIWAWSKGDFHRATAFDYFAGFIAVALNAAGIYGFTRAAASGATNIIQPPTTGAGSSPTVKEP